MATAERVAAASGRRRRDTSAGFAFLAPSLLGVAGFLLLPVAVVLGLSLFRWDLVSPARWTGLDNYRAILTDPAFGRSLAVTAVFVLLVIPLQTALGLAAAVLLDQRLPGSGVFRAILVLPWISAPLALGVVWRWLFDPSDGALNQLIGHRVEWLTDPALALPSVAAVTVWTNVGYVALFFLAGLAGIPPQYAEAARIDGAGPWQGLRRITLPLLRPTTFFVLATGVISSFQVFDTVYAMTQGGPAGRTAVVAYAIYREAFVDFRMGRAAAMSVVLFLLLITVTLAQQSYFRRRTTYEMG
ncbi:carbohydrate ABC transporter permease [Actinoplanes teichomyceticus]|uniref:Carbohydrate ABC transporter membrane protein 1 (CUT1 family) n=1 Tax=Actinoplanes teichomyceticus TaxID=1867 RepID=A0A561WA29_ACTTI|nr:sugar ABC transporter permease [Actinoplanes teichomyceticus]TWG20709.1 carbohydrate ABC transporter membrane protein 1 (CUT1 family) [Actinoplanes teichomyceticus]GIF14365.1 putative sugar ABC transporter, permease protein [Actinoplanes teichomyceticus]